MTSELVARHGFSRGGHVRKPADHAAQIALQFGTNPEAVGQEGHHAWQVGQQVGVDVDRQSRTADRGGFDGPDDIGLLPALLADEQGVALAGVPGLEFSNIGPPVEVDQSVTMRCTVLDEGLVALAERVGVVGVARGTDESPKLVG